MTVPQIKVRVVRKAQIKVKTLVNFPANVIAEKFLKITNSGGTYTLDVDYTILSPGPIVDPTTSYAAILDSSSGLYKIVSLSSLLSSALQITQIITAAGPAAINNNSGVVLVNQTVGAPITLTLPLSSAKTVPVLISDFKGDAGTNNITINLAGADKFPGNLTSWTIGGDTGSVFLRPISGVGYAL
jgi:hypothetical protein